MRFKPGTYQIDQFINAGHLEIGDGYRAKNSELSSTGIPFARAGNINQGFKFATADFFPLDSLKKVGNKVSRPGDVVFTSKGTVGRFALVGKGTQRFVYSPQLCFWRSLVPDELLPEYLYYWMNSAEFLQQISYLKGQTDMADYVSLRDQRKIKLTIPDTATQRSIVDILKPLDDRINLLRETNTTLETIAQALFKSWFVDFDPVHAKQEGHESEMMDADTDAFFPDSFEESELGLVPKGWGIRSLGSFLTLDKGLSYRGDFLKDTGVPMVNLGCFKGQGRFSQDAYKLYSGEFKDRHTVKPLDLVLANTDITQKRVVIGSPSLIPPHADSDRLIFSHHVYAARFNHEDVHWKLYVYFLLLQDGFRERAIGYATGTTVLSLPRDTVLEFQFIEPDLILRDRFTSIVMPLLERQWKNEQQAQTLATLRDTLLPRLISGQLCLPDAEALVGEV